MKIYTIGHSTHSINEFLNMLESSSIEWIADVRAFPGSKKHPQFSKDEFPKLLYEAGIGYTHFPKLGGRRKISSEIGTSLNDGWNNDSFHNYADYTLTPEFTDGINELTQLGSQKNTAYLCSERHPSRCHRLLISNWLTYKGWEVTHLINNSKGLTEKILHKLGVWGAMPIVEDDGVLIYPKLD